jgi:hypothetical protein
LVWRDPCTFYNYFWVEFGKGKEKLQLEKYWSLVKCKCGFRFVVLHGFMVPSTLLLPWHCEYKYNDSNLVFQSRSWFVVQRICDPPNTSIMSTLLTWCTMICVLGFKPLLLKTLIVAKTHMFRVCNSIFPNFDCSQYF